MYITFRFLAINSLLTARVGLHAGGTEESTNYLSLLRIQVVPTQGLLQGVGNV